MTDKQQSTFVSKMINAFRTQNEVSCEKEVNLMFDGEKLSPETTVGDTELSDMDTLDVFVR